MPETITIRVGKEVADKLRNLGPGTYSQNIDYLLTERDFPEQTRRLHRGHRTYRVPQLQDIIAPCEFEAGAETEEVKPIGTVLNDGTVNVDFAEFQKLLQRTKPK